MRLSLSFSLFLAAATALTSPAFSQDWGQFRGPARSGVTADGPAIASTFDKSGPAKIWQSPAEVPAGGDGGYGSVSVSDSRAYVYISRKSQKPLTTRRLDSNALRGFGWKPEIKVAEIPADLLKSIEAARTSADRDAFKQDRPAIFAWADKWVAANLSPEQVTKWGPYVKERISDVDRAVVSYDIQAKLVTIQNRPFEDEAAMNKWLDENAITGDVRAKIVAAIPTSMPAGNDTIVCMDTADGKVIWQKEHPGTQACDKGASGTPLVVDGRVYVTGAQTVYCLDAKDGTELWKAATKGDTCSSSPLLVDGRLFVLSGVLTALDAKDGKLLWTQLKVRGNNSSPAVWRKDGKTYIIANSDKLLACMNPEDGQIIWSCTGAGDGSPTIEGDTLVVMCPMKNPKENGTIFAYKLTAEKAEKLWSLECEGPGFQCSSPIIYKGYVYARPTHFLLCASLADGKLMWKEKARGDISSLVLADDKLLLVGDGGQLLMFRANPEKYEPLATANAKLAPYFTPAIVGGRMYARLPKTVACFDLTGASQPAAAGKTPEAAPAAN